MKAAVIGSPIHHSKSPMIHTYWLDQYNIKGSYEAVEIKADNLTAGVQDLIARGYDGFNVTIPHKENIMKLCHDVDTRAQKIGAVNTVVIKDGKLLGKNTDSFGFIQNIKSKNMFNFKGSKALVLGAGGASRAILCGLIDEGVSEIYLTNRTKSKAVELQKINPEKIKIIDWENKEDFLNDINLLVNTTSLGMIGCQELELNLENLNINATVTDIVYAPLMTPLLMKAQKRGHNIVTGIGMLLHQARPAFEAWTGILPDVTTALEQKVLR